MVDMGDIPFRTGGTSGAAHLLFGNWAELGEDVSTWTRSSVRTVEGFSSSQTLRPEIHSTAEYRRLGLGPQPRPVLIVTISLARPEFG
ncbi:hypothetical protein AUF78_00350 [archaeon 13_1_20CM_2_51_12]|nr:MAG: hypothetical protein AUF78_00350 [archaeon 13_1_20CM_2_51_12]